MNSSLQDRVLHSLGSCLRPLARVLLRSGISYKQFSEAAKIAFVEEAVGAKDPRGRVKNTSRVAIRTGLSRKEVARIKRQIFAAAESEPKSLVAPRRSSHAARVLQLWHVNPAYISSDGQPKLLPAAGDSGSFASLVKLAGGDVPPGAVRAELHAASAIDELPDGRLVPLRRYFIPGDVGEDLVVGLTHILAPVLEGLAHNTEPAKGDPFVQRLAYSDRLVPEAIPLFRKVAGARAAEFLQTMDDWLSSNEETSARLSLQGTTVGIGIFYYEGAQISVHAGHTPGTDKSNAALSNRNEIAAGTD